MTETTEAQITELENYVRIDATEVGDACQTLILMYQHRTYLSSEFVAAVEQEIEDQLTAFKTYFRIGKESKTVTYETAVLIPIEQEGT